MTGVEMLLSSMGLNPADIVKKLSDAGELIQSRVFALEIQNTRIEEKLDLLLSDVGLTYTPSPALLVAQKELEAWTANRQSKTPLLT